MLDEIFEIVMNRLEKQEKNKEIDEVKPKTKTKKKILVIGIVLAITALCITNTMYTVDAGERAVLLTWGKVNNDTIEPGLHFKMPIMQSIARFDTQTQKYEASASAASKDLQMVDTNIAVIYHLQTSSIPRIYSELGHEYGDKVIQPQVQEVLKAVTAKFSADQLITNRSAIATQVQTMLKERLMPYGIYVESTAITNFNFSESFNNAIEAKVTAQQQKQKAEMDLQRIQVEAEQKVVSAKAEADALRLQREAITPELLELRKIEVQRNAIEKWNGVLPTYTGINGMPLIGIPT